MDGTIMAPVNPRNPWDIQELYQNPATATSTAAVAERNLSTKPAQVQSNRPGAAKGNPGGGAYGSPSQSTATPGSQAANLPYGESSEWYGTGLSDYGGQIAMQSPQAFFDVYANQNLGLPFGSMTGSWLGSTFDPYSMAAAFGGSGEMDDRLAQGTQFMNVIGRPGVQFFDPKSIVISALQQFASGKGQLGDQFDIPENKDPYQQLQLIVNFLGQALQGTMDSRALQAYLASIQQYGMQIIGGVMTASGDKGGGLAGFEKRGNVAQQLLKALGPNGGL